MPEGFFERAVRAVDEGLPEGEALVLAVLAVAEAVEGLAARLLDDGDSVWVRVSTGPLDPLRVELGVAEDRPGGTAVWLPS